MVLADAFATPLGLLALAAVVPLVLLYLIQPDPRRMTLPTVRFLAADDEQGGSNPIVERLRRNLLLLLQVLVVALLALALASPYVTLAGAAATQPTVVVVDASASMATETGGGTRFDRALDAADGAVGSPTTVVVAGANTRVPVENADPTAAREALAGLTVTDAPGDLRAAIREGESLAGSESRLVVVSDFASGEDWRSAVQAASARGLDVSLRQVAGGGRANVGVVDRRFEGDQVVFTVKNTGAASADRTLSFAGQSRSLSLAPGDVATETFPLPAESARARLSPGDSFPTDDTVHVAVPADTTVDVLLLTNGEQRELRTALSVVDTVDLTVQRPPAAVADADAYDVVVFAEVDRERVLRSTVETAREVVADGGGVVVGAQTDVDRLGYGDLLPVRPAGVRDGTRVASVADHPVTRGFEFPAPDRHLAGNLTAGTALVETDDGSPLLAAVDREGGGRLLYYGYLPDQPAFRYSYRFPVFWKRATHWAAGRPELTDINRQTGTTLAFDGPTEVETPTGTRTAATLTLDRAGLYTTADQETSAALLSVAESNVTAPRVEDATVGGSGSEEERRRQDLTPLAVLGVLLVSLGELGFLRYRGDI